MGQRDANYAHMQVVEDLKNETLQEFVNQYLTKGSVVQCDGCSSYRGLAGVNCHEKRLMRQAAT